MRVTNTGGVPLTEYSYSESATGTNGAGSFNLSPNQTYTIYGIGPIKVTGSINGTMTLTARNPALGYQAQAADAVNVVANVPTATPTDTETPTPTFPPTLTPTWTPTWTPFPPTPTFPPTLTPAPTSCARADRPGHQHARRRAAHGLSADRPRRHCWYGADPGRICVAAGSICSRDRNHCRVVGISASRGQPERPLWSNGHRYHVDRHRTARADHQPV